MNHLLLEYKHKGLYKIKITGGTYGYQSGRRWVTYL